MGWVSKNLWSKRWFQSTETKHWWRKKVVDGSQKVFPTNQGHASQFLRRELTTGGSVGLEKQP